MWRNSIARVHRRRRRGPVQRHRRGFGVQSLVLDDTPRRRLLLCRRADRLAAVRGATVLALERAVGGHGALRRCLAQVRYHVRPVCRGAARLDRPPGKSDRPGASRAGAAHFPRHVGWRSPGPGRALSVWAAGSRRLPVLAHRDRLLYAADTAVHSLRNRACTCRRAPSRASAVARMEHPGLGPRGGRDGAPRNRRSDAFPGARRDCDAGESRGRAGGSTLGNSRPRGGRGLLGDGRRPGQYRPSQHGLRSWCRDHPARRRYAAGPGGHLSRSLVDRRSARPCERASSHVVSVQGLTVGSARWADETRRGARGCRRVGTDTVSRHGVEIGAVGLSRLYSYLYGVFLAGWLVSLAVWAGRIDRSAATSNLGLYAQQWRRCSS